MQAGRERSGPYARGEQLRQLLQRRLPPLGDLHGCTLNRDPNWLSVFSQRTASIATRALNFGLYCFRVVVIASPAFTTPPQCLVQSPTSADH